MALFNIKKKLEYNKEKPFRLEKEIQDLTEENLKIILGLDFVKSEFALNNFRYLSPLLNLSRPQI